MNVADVLSHAQELIGQSVKVEGFLIRLKWTMNKYPWYMASPDMVQAENFDQAIEVVEPAWHPPTENNPVGEMAQKKLDRFFQKAAQNQFPELSESQARDIWRKIHFGIAERKDIEGLIHANALDDLIEAKQLNREELGRDHFESKLSYLHNSMIFSKHYKIYPGYIIGTLAPYSSDLSDLTLIDNTKAVFEDQRGTFYLSQEALDFAEIPLGINEITSTLKIIQHPEQYIGEVHRLDGLLAYRWKHGFILFPNGVFMDVREFSIPIRDENFSQKVYDSSRETIELDPKIVETAQVVGKLQKGSNPAAPIEITDISAAASQYAFNTIFRWKL